MALSLHTSHSLRGWCLGLILAVTGTGCVPIPVPIGAFSAKVFPVEVRQRLSQKDADKTFVQRQLGPPSTVRGAGRYWFYATVREVVGFIGADLVVEDYEWLAIGFDVSDQVTFIEFSDSMSGCLSNGICHDSGLLYTKPHLSVLSAPKADDQAAKAYRVSDDECAIYMYMEPFPITWAGAPGMKLSMDGSSLGVINHKTYLFLTHATGTMRIGAYQAELTTHCRGGEKLYVKVTPSWASYEQAKELSAIEPLTGDAALRSRRLALPY